MSRQIFWNSLQGKNRIMESLAIERLAASTSVYPGEIACASININSVFRYVVEMIVFKVMTVWWKICGILLCLAVLFCLFML